MVQDSFSLSVVMMELAAASFPSQKHPCQSDCYGCLALKWGCQEGRRVGDLVRGCAKYKLSDLSTSLPFAHQNKFKILQHVTSILHQRFHSEGSPFIYIVNKHSELIRCQARFQVGCKQLLTLSSQWFYRGEEWLQKLMLRKNK